MGHLNHKNFRYQTNLYYLKFVQKRRNLFVYYTHLFTCVKYIVKNYTKTSTKSKNAKK